MFDLTITFSGLCLLVRDPGKDMLHVLMPFPTHPHSARLIYVDEAGQVQKQDISRMHLELPGVTGSNGFSANVSRDVFDFGGGLLGARKVRRTLLEPANSLPPADVVRTRMRLTAGEHGHCRKRGGWWNFPLNNGTASVRLPTAMDWRIHDVDLPHLDIVNQAGPGSFRVFPRDGRIHLLVVHVTEEELKVIGPDLPEHSNCPPDKKPGEHFKLYEELLNPPGLPTPPLFDRPKSHNAGLCATPVALTRLASLTHDQTAAVAGAAAAATAASIVSATPADAAVAAAAAASAASAALSAAAAAAGGSELTCMLTTAPAE